MVDRTVTISAVKTYAFSSLNIYLARSNSFDQVSNYLDNIFDISTFKSFFC